VAKACLADLVDARSAENMRLFIVLAGKQLQRQ
ncbi:uncharacterized protein METZ01_LOCUS312276, partial [marine metagenome]